MAVNKPVGERAVLGWPIAVTTPWGTLMIPVWLSWIACAAAILVCTENSIRFDT